MPEQLGQAAGRGDDRHGLLGADHGDRHDGHPGPHGDLHEAAPAESAQLIALGVRLARALRALGKDQGQLLVVVEDAVGVVGVGDDAAAPGPQRSDHRKGPEEVVGQPVHRTAELLLDAVHDRRCVGRDGAGVVGDEERAAGGGDLVQTFPLGAEPAAVHHLVDLAHAGSHTLRATPFVDVAGATPRRLRLGWRGRGSERQQLGAEPWLGPSVGPSVGPSLGPSVGHRLIVLAGVLAGARRPSRPALSAGA